MGVLSKRYGAPVGWVWSDERPDRLYPAKNKNVFVYSPKVFDAVYAWAKKYGLGLFPFDMLPVYTKDRNRGYVWASLKVTEKGWKTTEKYFGTGLGQSGKSLGDWENQNCRLCMGAGLPLANVGNLSGVVFPACTRCTDVCTTSGCNNRYIQSEGNDFRIEAKLRNKCRNCAPIVRCLTCHVFYHKNEARKLKDIEGFICRTCEAAHICQICSKYSKRETEKIGDKLRCYACATKYADSERTAHEKFDLDELPQGGDFKLTPYPARPVRVVSIETEVDGDKNYLGQTLYNCGIVRVPSIESYGTQTPDDSSWAAFLKHDGSVTGGELISFLFQFDKSAHSKAFINTLSKLRSLEKINKIAFNATCGGHIHIDAHNFDEANVWRLLVGYNFLESVIYRLAGAGSSYGHRTLVPGHDRANSGHGYSLPTLKGPWGIKSSAYRTIRQQDRMSGLNFVSYVQAQNYHGCDSVARKCKCVLPRNTIEWRVWNSTGNPRIIHAWLAFMQSLHAWADLDDEPSDAFEHDYPPFEWQYKAWKDETLTRKKEHLNKVEWIFSNLIFSPGEKDSLLYAFSKTDIEFPSGFLSRMRTISGPDTQSPARPVPRSRYIRKSAISIKEPSPTADPRTRVSAAYHSRRRAR